MLTLTRSVGESIRIGEDIEVYVVEVRGGTVRLGFKAPREVVIHREEVYRQIAEANALAAEVAADMAGALAAFAPSRTAAAASPQAAAEAASPAAAPAAGSAPVSVPVEALATGRGRPVADQAFPKK
jgi:carbon storage regulator